MNASGFWGEYPPEAYESSGSKFLERGEFETLAKAGARIQVFSVTGPHPSDLGGTKFVVTFVINGGDEERAKSFSIGDEDGNETSRDRLLRDMQTWLDEHPTQRVPVRFVLWGRMFGIEPDLDSAQDRDGTRL
jgi:hypothetical protein